MSETENEQTETEGNGNAVSEAGQPTPDEQAPGYGDPTEGEGEQEGAPQPVTQGDLRPGDDEHGVDTTPPQSQDQPNAGVEPGDAHEPMNKMDERAEPNTRGNAGSDD